HEDISALIMNRLNEEMNGQLDTAIEIFNNHYPKKFLHQLVSSQLDMDRLDYLRRDSFYSGVTEGQVSSERIIKMLNVVDDQLVVEEKGIYSIEKFIVARRLMYWQVYLHKTVISAEFMLVNILKRAKELSEQGQKLFGSPTLQTFLEHDFGAEEFNSDSDTLERYARLDDYDILGAIKVWQSHQDPILSLLCQRLVSRKLFKTEVQKSPFSSDYKLKKVKEIQERFDIAHQDCHYLLIDEKVDNRAYSAAADSIMIRFKNGTLKDVASASDHLNLHALSQPVEKYFLCYPRM
ncbi:MAG: phosphohydrolase, partial [Flavobacteriales bacterium]|nr:phosphohydrolase [Flavobacteriales bacterium]